MPTACPPNLRGLATPLCTGRTIRDYHHRGLGSHWRLAAVIPCKMLEFSSHANQEVEIEGRAIGGLRVKSDEGNQWQLSLKSHLLFIKL